MHLNMLQRRDNIVFESTEEEAEPPQGAGSVAHSFSTQGGAAYGPDAIFNLKTLINLREVFE